MKVVKIEKKNNYIVVPNSILRDKRISIKARGLLIIILSLPPKWKLTVSGLVTVTGAGETAVRAGLRELEKYGYVQCTRARDSKGRIGCMDYIIREVPLNEENPKVENPKVENPEVEKPELENLGVVSTDIVSTDIVSTNIVSTNIVSTNIVSTNDMDSLQSRYFKVFWNTYPKHIKIKETKEYWNKLPVDIDLYDKIIKSVTDYKKTEQWLDPTYIPNPLTYLSDERWRDEITHVKAIKKNDVRANADKVYDMLIGQRRFDTNE